MSNPAVSEVHTEHHHRAVRRSVDTRTLYCKCGRFLNEIGKWIAPPTTSKTNGREK